MTVKTLTLLLLFPLSALAQEKTIDLTSPENYANQPVPSYITKDNTPDDNEITDLGATLGRVLFYDKRLSTTDTISCSSCHQQENAFGDTSRASTGVNGLTGRHSPRLINTRFSDEEKFFWDERADTLEDQGTQPIQDHIEMGFSGVDGDPSFSDLIVKLSVIEEYQVLFQGVFGDATVTEERVGKALAQFVRSIQSFDSKYDVGRAQDNDNQDFSNFTASENAGKQLFLGGANCATCHVPPEFDIDPDSGNNGVVTTLNGGTDFTNTRSPSIRDLVDPDGNSNGAFMHDASLATLEDMIDHYDSIPAVVTGLDRRLQTGRPGSTQPQDLNLTTQEKSDLAAFLRTLTGTSVYTDEKYSTPFNSDDTLATVILPAESAEMTFATDSNNNRTATLRATGIPNVGYVFQTSTDLVSWSSTPLTAGTDGSMEVEMPILTTEQKRFYRFAYGVEADE